MKKKLDTRFPAARIKKIMQADEDVGKIAMAVPLLVSKALELFLQDLCNRTYDITLKRGAKTLNSLHLKQCVQTFNVFDFLREIMRKVPDLGGQDTAGEDRPVAKRRKIAGDEGNESEEDLKKSHVLEVGHTISSGRGGGGGGGRGMGRGRGRGRPRKTDSAMDGKFEDDPDNIQSDYFEVKYDHHHHHDDSKENVLIVKPEPEAAASAPPVRNFDLNVDLDENGDTKAANANTATAAAVPSTSSGADSTRVDEVHNHEEYPGWYLTDVQKMAMDPLQLASLNRNMDEDEEDYDEEG